MDHKHSCSYVMENSDFSLIVLSIQLLNCGSIVSVEAKFDLQTALNCGEPVNKP